MLGGLIGVLVRGDDTDDSFMKIFTFGLKGQNRQMFYLFGLKKMEKLKDLY